jgi:hypothetical protein
MNGITTKQQQQEQENLKQLPTLRFCLCVAHQYSHCLQLALVQQRRLAKALKKEKEGKEGRTQKSEKVSV